MKNEATKNESYNIQFNYCDGTIRTELEALEAQRWSLSLGGGMRLDGGSEFSLSYNRDFSDEDERDSFELRFLVPF